WRGRRPRSYPGRRRRSCEGLLPDELDREIAVPDVDLDRAAVRDVPGDQRSADLGLHLAGDETPQWPGTVHRVETPLCHQPPRRVGNVQPQPPIREPALEFGEL